jgi:hypothetical protein
MKFSAMFPELNENQIKMLIRLMEDVIGETDPIKEEPDMDMRLGNMIRNDLRSSQREALRKLITDSD